MSSRQCQRRRLNRKPTCQLSLAVRIGRGFSDQAFSLVDCTSFAVMERRRIDTAATFDVDFAVYRYCPTRGRAFRVVGGSGGDS